MSIEDCLKETDALLHEWIHYRHLDNYRIREALETEYTYESNRIEGNTLTLRETDLVINKGLTISGKPLQDHLEAINHRDALAFVKELVTGGEPLTQRALLQVHQLILQGINREGAGRYRSVPVTISGSKHMPPQPYFVPKGMEDFFIWYTAEASRLHPIVCAAEVHERIVFIHPFIDGNGRTCRLIMNLILLQAGYPIAIISGEGEARAKYYDALESASVTGDRAPFTILVCQTVQDALRRLLKIVGA